METANTDYDNHRFSPTVESLAAMKSLRDDLENVKSVHPEIAGLSFFGSRTVGLESRSSDNPSDLDMNIFYDGSAFIPNETHLRFENGRLTVNKNAKTEYSQKTAARNALTHSLSNYYLDKLRSLNLPSNQTTPESKKPTVNIIDISEQATGSVLNDFINEVNTLTNWGKEELKDDKMSANTINLLSRFHLGVGIGLYKNRQLILDELEAMPEGERYFKMLMNLLNIFERTKPTDNRDGLKPARLPASIAEAREYFRTLT